MEELNSMKQDEQFGTMLASTSVEYTEEIYNALVDFIYSKSIKSTWIGIGGLGLLFLGCLFKEEYNYIAIILILHLIFFIATLVKNINAKKNSLSLLKQRKNQKLSLKLYDEYIVVDSVFDMSANHLVMKYDDLVKVLADDNYIFLQFKSHYVVLDKSKNSINVYNILINRINKIRNIDLNPKIVKSLSIGALSPILAFVILIIIIAILGSVVVDFAIQDYIWIFLLGLPVSLMSTIIGFIYRNKGYKCNANIIIGIVTSIVFIIYGAMIFIV